ncbi:MAG: sigma-70 family RNA polymerase sigma factor [Polyangiaceae bacterium]
MATSASRVPYLRVVSGASALDEDVQMRRGLARGERWATAAIWKRFAPRVFAMLSQGLGRASDAEDLTQDVLLSVFREGEGARRAKGLAALVYGETARVLTRELRREARRRLWGRSTHLRSFELLGAADATERAALHRLYALLDQLSAEDRVLFVLHQVEGLGELDIAEALELSLPKLRKRISRLLDKVQRRVECDPVLEACLSNEPRPAERDLREGA